MDHDSTNHNDAQLVERFRADGYVALPGFLNAQEVTSLCEHVERFVRDIAPQMPAEQVFYEDKADRTSLKQLQQMFEYDAFFRSMMFGSRFEKLASTLLQTEVRGVNMQYFNKPPGISQPTPPHQDGYYFMLEPSEAVTMWLALEDVDEETGCVRYVNGSHLLGLRPHRQTQTLGFSQGILDFGTKADVSNEVPFPAKPGDLLVHHALTIHRADKNRSTTRSRKALGFIYYSADATESPQKKQRQAALVEQLRLEGKV